MNSADLEAAKLVPTEGQLDEQLRVSVEALLHPTPSSIPSDEVDGLLLAINHHLHDEASERKKISNRLLAIQSEMEGLATKQIIATRLGWTQSS